MTGDDCWELTCAVTGDPTKATDKLFTPGVVALINALREERDHLLNQLAAAERHVEVIAGKRAYAVNPWIHHDIQTLQRLLASHTPAWRRDLEEHGID